MRIGFVGHLSLDRNVIGGVEQRACGGGSFYGAVAARRLGADATLLTKCAPADREAFAEVEAAGVRLLARPSPTTTSIRNDYPTDDPDDRITRMLSRAAPFDADDLRGLDVDALHVNPLWFGEFPPALLAEARARAPLLAADGQGFLRNVGEDGATFHRDWADKERWLPLLDLLKVDLGEARTMTGLDEPRAAAAALAELGAGIVVLTRSEAVLVFDGDRVAEAPFGPYRLEGRTGRGDTCAAAFLVARARGLGLDAATRFTAEVTARKMQYPGPLRPARRPEEGPR